VQVRLWPTNRKTQITQGRMEDPFKEPDELPVQRKKIKTGSSESAGQNQEGKDSYLSSSHPHPHPDLLFSFHSYISLLISSISFHIHLLNSISPPQSTFSPCSRTYGNNWGKLFYFCKPPLQGRRRLVWRKFSGTVPNAPLEPFRTISYSEEEKGKKYAGIKSFYLGESNCNFRRMNVLNLSSQIGRGKERI